MTVKGGVCESLPSAWVDPATPEEVAWALAGCAVCPVMEQCREFAGKFRWHHPTVIAGWQPPDLSEKRAPGGILPPWTPKGYRVLRPLTGAGRERRH